ncbi:MAG TPA: prolipoprotein diacylglyceryl transferase family protein [Gemmatimonadaceae bacterium]|nr:prolipoprotein diacylglyceryl transferase family protein [Gemmatimonadaceae bacterium]
MSPLEIVIAGWYNLFYMLAIVVAATVMLDAGRRRGRDLGAWSFVVALWVAGGIIGAMLPGLVLGDLAAARTALGAIAGATVALVLAARSAGLRAAEALDATAVAIPLGGAVARIGCFLAECCQGVVTRLPVGLALDPDDAPRHPVQLYEAGLEVILALVLLRRRDSFRRPGSAMLASTAGLAAIRFATEFVRDNEKLGPLSLAQWVVLPVAMACAALLIRASDGERLVSGSKGRLSVPVAMLVAGALALLAASHRLPPLESAALFAAFALVAVILSIRLRAAAPAGAAALALQMPAITADSTYPRVYNSVGGGFTFGSYDYRHQQSSCDGVTEDWTRHTAFVGGAAEVGTRTYSSPTRAVGLRARAYYGNHQTGRAVVRAGTPRQPGPYSTSSLGVSIAGDLDWTYFGMSLGVNTGSVHLMLPMDYGDPPEPVNLLPAIGVRVGKLHGLSLEARFADEVPFWAPAPVATFAVGVGDANGNRFRGGISEAGLFLGGRLIRPTGLEISPSIGIGGEGEVSSAVQTGVMVRKWIRAGRRD